MNKVFSVDGKIVQMLEWIFKISILFYALLSFNSFCYGKTIISLVLWPTVLLGCFLIIIRCINYKKYVNMPGLIFLLLFLVSYGISMLGNIQYGYKEGIVKYVFLAFYFCLLFLKRNDISKKDMEQEVKIIGGVFEIYMFFAVISSFALFAVGYSSVNSIESGWDIGIGFLWGRLWGVFTEPNFGAVCACVAIVLAIYFLSQTKNFLMKVLIFVNIVLQIFYIAFSDSRTGRVSFALAVAFLVFNNLNFLRIRNKQLKLYAVIFAVGLSAVGSFMLPKAITKTYNNLNEYIQISKIQEEQEKDELDTEDKKLNIQIQNQVDRGYDLSKDPSNRRFDIWKSGIEVFMTTPIIGTSFSNILPYALEHCENTYLVNNSSGEYYVTIHNEFLNVLTSQGLIGITVLIGLIIYVAKYYIKNYFKLSMENQLLNSILISCLVAVTAGSMFLAGMFYSNSPTIILFWIFLGQFLINMKLAGKE